jgi:PiT family inorganic phosphate transporter
MLFLLFITSGLLLGWSLGANDAANIFGTAIGSRMIKFGKAAAIASIFVVIGATLQGGGTTKTLSQLGTIDALGGAFTVTLCSALIVTWMNYYKLPVSTSQAIVGAILGWCYYTASKVDYSVLTMIIGAWVMGPILGAIFSSLLYLLMRLYIRKTKLHVIKLDAFIRNGLLIAGAFGAYSLGSNNIANVMGVFVNSTSFNLHIGSLSISSTQMLFFLGGIAIATGILTHSKRIIKTVGEGILEMTAETAIVIVLSQALVLFIFSSTALSNLLVNIGLSPIPLVPISSTQVVVGAIIGIGAVKGVQEIRLKQLGGIVAGWLLTPVLAGIATFITLFFISNVFKIAVSNKPVSVNQQPVKSTFLNISAKNVEMASYCLQRNLISKKKLT